MAGRKTCDDLLHEFRAAIGKVHFLRPDFTDADGRVGFIPERTWCGRDPEQVRVGLQSDVQGYRCLQLLAQRGSPDCAGN